MGNFQNSPVGESERIRCPGSRRLVEECEIVSVYAVQAAFGKRPLIDAIRQARPFRLPVSGGHFDVWLVDESHRLPGACAQWSSLEQGTARLWFVCPACLRKTSKLYYFQVPGSLGRSDLLCRLCHGLTYLVSNSGANRWYKEIARPMKRLLRVRDKLMARRQEPGVAARLIRIEDQIRELRRKAKPKTPPQRVKSLYKLSLQRRRPYRNLALLE